MELRNPLVYAAVAAIVYAGGLKTPDLTDRVHLMMPHRAEVGFYQSPYSLKLDRVKNEYGNIETYLVDCSTGERMRIRKDFGFENRVENFFSKVKKSARAAYLELNK